MHPCSVAIFSIVILETATALHTTTNRTIFYLMTWNQYPYGGKEHMLHNILKHATLEFCPHFKIEILERHFDAHKDLVSLVTANNASEKLEQLGLANYTNLILGPLHPNAGNFNFDEFSRTSALLESPGVVAVMPASRIALPSRLFYAVAGCSTLFWTLAMLAVTLALLMWMAERRVQQGTVPNNFINGFGTSLWWSVVTMATVGYGDVVPRTILGRLIGTVWMTSTMVLIAAISSTTTSNLASFEPDIINKTVAVVGGTWCYVVAQQRTKVILAIDAMGVKEYSSDKETLHALQHDQKIYATLMDYNIAASMESEIEALGLRSTYFYPSKFFLYTAFHFDNATRSTVKELIHCLENSSPEIRGLANNVFVPHITMKALDIGSFKELFTQSPYTGTILAAILAGTVLAGIVWEYIFLKNAFKSTAVNQPPASPTLRLKELDYQLKIKALKIKLIKELQDIEQALGAQPENSMS